MVPATRRSIGKILGIVAFASLGLIPLWLRSATAADKLTINPVAKFGSGNLKFSAAMSCQGSNCHSKAAAAAPPAQSGIELTIWKSSDPHRMTFTSLVKPDVKKDPKFGDIAKNLKIADAAKSERCLGCHALNVPETLKEAGPAGEMLTLKEGVSCDACHGPSEKYFKVHSKVGWLDGERKKLDHDGLLKTHGLYDTKPVVARAEKCVTCHLAIDDDLVKAGHPQPIFELAYYSDFKNFENLSNHWRDPGGYFGAKLWAAGQVICLRDAMTQLAARGAGGAPADSLKDAYEQAMGHYGVFKQLLAAKAVAGDAAGMDAAVAKLSAAMKAASGKDVAASATAIAAMADKLAPIVGAYDPDKDPASVTKVLAAIAADATLAKDNGLHGVEQQALAINTLYLAYASGKKVADAEVKATSDIIAGLFKSLDDKKVDPDYTKALSAAAAKMPK